VKCGIVQLAKLSKEKKNDILIVLSKGSSGIKKKKMSSCRGNLHSSMDISFKTERTNLLLNNM